MLSVLASFTITDANDITRRLADDFRKRRIEKGLTRDMIAEKSGVAVANIARFEQKGLISLTNLAKLAIALSYITELQNVFATPKFSTTDELMQIRRNQNKKKAYPKKS